MQENARPRRRLTVRQLEVLASVGREGSVTAAAAQLHLTQPAVSMQLRQVEDAFGLALFEQVGRRLEITEPGRALLPLAEEILSRIDDFEQTAAALRGLRTGRIRLGLVSTAKYFAPRLIAQFGKTHPGIEFKLTVHNREQIIERLRSYSIDLGLMGRPPEGMDFVGLPFAPNPLIVVAATTHPLSLRRRMEPRELDGEPLIVREPGSGTRIAMDRFFAETGVRCRQIMEADSNETIKQAVMAGMGLGFLSMQTVRAELAEGRIAMLDVQGLPLRRQWFVVHPRARRLTPAPAEFREFLLHEADALMRVAL